MQTAVRRRKPVSNPIIARPALGSIRDIGQSIAQAIVPRRSAVEDERAADLTKGSLSQLYGYYWLL
jgi:ribosomal protein S13